MKLFKFFSRQMLWKNIGALIGGVVLFGLLIGVSVFAYYAKDLPNPSTLGEQLVAESTKIYDSSGETVLFNIHGEIKRTIIPFDEIPQHMKEATIALEDANFYDHFGVDFKGIARAVLTNLRRGTLREGPGGSTITQQFIKNTILTPEKSLSRKIREWILAIEMERQYEKDEILDFYLNQIPYGSNAYGVEAAAQTYFDKKAQDLTLGEAALLAALPQAPSYYITHQDDLHARKEHALNRMRDLGFISAEDAEAAKQEEIAIDIRSSGITAPHFVMFVREYLEQRYGTDIVERGGLQVYTTLDMHIQNIAEESIDSHAERNQERYGANNAAAVVIDPKNGKVRAMVGSRDFLNKDIDGQVNVTVTPQQPGSSFKPLVYALAFEKGFTPETVLFDVQTNFGVQGAREFIPRNYDDAVRGPMTIRNALAQSINIPAVKALHLVGIDTVLNYAQEVGITTLTDRDAYGLSLVLGAGDVYPLELTNAYAAFAHDGIIHPYAFIERVEDQDGTVLESFEENPKRVLDPNVARQISDVLSDNTARIPTFGSSSPLVVPGRPVAVKTGTTQLSRDAWTIGYTPQLVVGVWAGNTDNTRMRFGGGSTVAGPIWNEIMRKSLDGVPVESFPSPREEQLPNKPMLNGSPVHEEFIAIDTATGQPATASTPPGRIAQERFREAHTILHFADPNDPKNPSTTGQQNSQYQLWEDAVLAWAQRPDIQQQYMLRYRSEIHGGGTSIEGPSITVESPTPGHRITGTTIPLRATITAQHSIQIVEFLWDGNVVATDRTMPFETTLALPTSTQGADHIVSVRAFDAQDNQSVVHVPVIVEGNTTTTHLEPVVLLTTTTPTPVFRVDMETTTGSPFRIQIRQIAFHIIDTETSERIETLLQQPSNPATTWSQSWETAEPGSYRIEVVLETHSGALLQTPSINLDL